MKIENFLTPMLALCATSGSTTLEINNTFGTCPNDESVKSLALKFLASNCINPEYNTTMLAQKSDLLIVRTKSMTENISAVCIETVLLALGVFTPIVMLLRAGEVPQVDPILTIIILASLVIILGTTINQSMRTNQLLPTLDVTEKDFLGTKDTESEQALILIMQLAAAVLAKITVAIGIVFIDAIVLVVQSIDQKKTLEKDTLVERKLALGRSIARETDTTNDPICPICYEVFTPDQILFNHTTPNGIRHFFHYPCIQQWFDTIVQDRQNLTCPICKMEL